MQKKPEKSYWYKDYFSLVRYTSLALSIILGIFSLTGISNPWGEIDDGGILLKDHTGQTFLEFYKLGPASVAVCREYDSGTTFYGLDLTDQYSCIYGSYKWLGESQLSSEEPHSAEFEPIQAVVKQCSKQVPLATCFIVSAIILVAFAPGVHYIRKLLCPITKPRTWRISKLIEIISSSLGLLFYFIAVVGFANGCITSRAALELEETGRSVSTRSGLVLAIFGLLGAIVFCTMHIISICCGYETAKFVYPRKGKYKELKNEPLKPPVEDAKELEEKQAVKPETIEYKPQVIRYVPNRQVGSATPQSVQLIDRFESADANAV